MKKRERWFVYILKASDGSLYTGICRDIEKRILTHNSGKGSRYLRGRAPLTLMHREIRFSRSTASKREAHIKTLTRSQKMELIRGTDAS